MLTEKQLSEIRTHLDKAQNPIFLYDNDVDGFCSYVLLRKYLGRGKGVAVKSHPDIDKGYVRRAQELNADYIFVLDRPLLGEVFVKEAETLHLPIVWIDHHDIEENYISDYLFTYNPQKQKEKSSEPTTYLCYKVTNRREDMWVAMIGCIADHYLPEFSKEFEEQYPEFWGKNLKKPFDVYYKSGIGKLIRVLSFGLKDSITHVVQLQNFIVNSKNPSEIEEELDTSKSFVLKYKEILNKYLVLLKDSKKCVKENILFFNYGGTLSISSDLSNELSYLFPDKYIVVVYTSGPISNISMRGVNVRKILSKIIKDFEGATGGGHQDAVGSRIRSVDLERFKEGLFEELNKNERN